MKDKDNDVVVIKANELIQQYKYTLSKTEIRIVNFIISNINSPAYDEEFNVMSFDINEFCKMLGWSDPGGDNYRQLRYTLRKLSMMASDYIDFGDYETIVRWIEKPIFEKGTGIVKLKLDDDLKPFLLQANGKIQAKLKFYFDMDSKYSMRLYELMRSYDGFDHIKLDIDDLKMKIDAMQKSYNNFAKFRQAALDPAVAEINDVTDIEISYELAKRGRKVIAVIFSIAKKKIKTTKANEQLAGQMDLINDFPETVPDQDVSLMDNKYQLWSEACDMEFNLPQIKELSLLAEAHIEYYPGEPERHDLDLYQYLRKKYVSLANKKIEKSRFGYMKYIVENNC